MSQNTECKKRAHFTPTFAFTPRPATRKQQVFTSAGCNRRTCVVGGAAGSARAVGTRGGAFLESYATTSVILMVFLFSFSFLVLTPWCAQTDSLSLLPPFVMAFGCGAGMGVGSADIVKHMSREGGRREWGWEDRSTFSQSFEWRQCMYACLHIAHDSIDAR